MRALAKATILAGLALGLATTAGAGEGSKVPIASDLRKWERSDHRMWRWGFLPDDVDATGSVVPDNSVTPRNQMGVVGFDGPPGIIGDGVGSYSPLPPGANGNEDWW